VAADAAGARKNKEAIVRPEPVATKWTTRLAVIRVLQLIAFIEFSFSV
jgi:hypothetical protein